jgi:antitoxin MazE
MTRQRRKNIHLPEYRFADEGLLFKRGLSQNFGLYRQSRYEKIYFVASRGETRMRAEMVKWGNSLAIRIPKPVAAQAKLKEGDSLEIEVAGEGQVALRKRSRMPTLEKLVSQITPENRYGEIPAGAEVGKEVVEW